MLHGSAQYQSFRLLFQLCILHYTSVHWHSLARYNDEPNKRRESNAGGQRSLKFNDR